MFCQIKCAVRVIERRRRWLPALTMLRSFQSFLVIIQHLSPCHSWPLRVPNQPLVCEDGWGIEPL